MRSNYDFSDKILYDKIKELEHERKKKLEAARIEAIKQDQRQEIISTMNPTVANINSTINILESRVYEKQKEFDSRISALEENAAVRSWSPKQSHKKLHITVRA